MGLVVLVLLFALFLLLPILVRLAAGGDWPETLNTLILSEEAGKTTITQTVLYPSKEARDAALKTGMKEGVSESFDRLAEHLRTMA